MGEIKKIQKIILDNGTKLYGSEELFYRNGKPVKSEEGYYIAAYSAISFETYFNSLGIEKYKKYTTIDEDNIFLELNATGRFRINLIGLSGRKKYIQREVIYSEEVDLEKKASIKFRYPNTLYTCLSFEIETISDVKIYDAYYSAKVKKETEVKLMISITTHKREEYIVPNIERIRENCIKGNKELSEKLWLQVIDNGQTLNKKEIEEERIKVYYNKNMGGASGCVRGMMEVIKQNEAQKGITHYLIMDDDVVILPEVIEKTYYLLRILKDEYKSHWIPGAMLSMQNKSTVTEVLGQINSKSETRPINTPNNVSKIEAFLDMEENINNNVANVYGGWWYCVIPMSYITRENLPLPVFIRGDDIEFALRNKAKYIPMMGIGVWHESFMYKYTPIMDIYFVWRNFFVMNASIKIDRANLIKSFDRLFHHFICKFNYYSVELLLKALEDYLKGPKFLENNMDATLLSELKNIEVEQYRTTLKTKYENVSIQWLRHNQGLSFVQRLIYKYTYNGQRGLFGYILNKGDATIIYRDEENKYKNYLKKRLIYINPYDNEYLIKEIDRKRFKKLYKKYKILRKEYNRNNTKVKEEYLLEKQRFMSYDFWKQKLEV